MKIGTYSQKQIGNTRTYKRKRKYNQTFRGTLTIREQKEQRRMALLLITGFILIGIVQSIVMTTNTIHINGSAVSASECVEPLLVGEVVPPAPSPADVVREITAYNAGEKQIREIAKEVNFKWTDYLVRLAMCESSLNPNAINDNGNHGIDRGIFQINNRYHWEVLDECAFDIDCATRWTINRINTGYQYEWMCDKKI